MSMTKIAKKKEQMLGFAKQFKKLMNTLEKLLPGAPCTILDLI